MTDNQKKIQVNQIKTYLQERIKKIESGETGGWELFKTHEKYILDEGSERVIFSWIPDLKETNYLFITTLENYEVKNQEHIRVWGYGLKQEDYLLIDPQDYVEIVNLTKQRNQLRETKITQQEKERDQKLANNPKLFYGWWMSGTWAPADKRQGLTFAEFRGQKEGRNYWLMLPKSHPSLVNLERKEGQFYLIEGLENIPIEPSPSRSTGENNPNNFNRWVELTDKITITPYEVKNDNKLPENFEKKAEVKDKSGCDTCHKKLGKDWGGSDNFYIIKRYHGKFNIGDPVIWACRDCYPTKEQEYLDNYETVWERYLDKDGSFDYRQIKFSFVDCYAGHKDQNGKILKQQNCPHCQPWKKSHQNLNVSEMDIKSLIQYLQKYSIKEISFKNGELVITHNNNNNNNNNNNEIVSTEKINDKQEWVLFRDVMQKSNQQKITKEDLEKMLNANTISTEKPKGDNTLLWVVGGIGGILIIGVIIGLVARKKITKNK